MTSSWTERQGQVGDLQGKSKEELCEILRRQEKLLSNKKFVQSLPDKGKKIIDFVQRLHLAVAKDEEEEKKQDLLLAVKTEFQSKYQQALAQRAPGNHDTESGPELSKTSQEVMGHSDTDSPIVPLGACVQDSAGSNGLIGFLDSTALDVVGMETCDKESGSLEGVKEDITEAFERVTLSEDAAAPSLSKARLCEGVTDNPFWGRRPQKKPHCVEIVEKTEINVSSRKVKFKPNQPLLKADGSPSDSSPSAQSPGTVSPLSIEARRQRDRKHLDDITAAKQRPLHHSPAQLLNLAESVSLLQEHSRKYEELQAKVAAQKLAERLGVSTEPCGPDVRVLRAYREVRDIGDHVPSDED
ncbi:protein GRINL1A isoform X2 [Brienomyrus brachyistius]|uniref:protein GRINL1A isoform X2 n=1 Tax=Brienomyrus brachyistius TaxID=42636 RepID=UPI0020B1F8C3|nr:protein GRINL1A isoform X2 [Brienomyrus brachyistius]